MIRVYEIPDGIIVESQPFTKPSRNVNGRIIAEIKSSHGRRRDVHVRLCDFGALMTLTDVAVLGNALRTLATCVQEKMDEVQQEAKAKVKRSRKK
ncbi:hypothetical protein [Methanoregula sp.]|jgi:hypothetical protein|uniref:hypothetical protein n=1 Tax=Methanoregula sp. TaxID=2052170 RepID=UPI003561714A